MLNTGVPDSNKIERMSQDAAPTVPRLRILDMKVQPVDRGDDAESYPGGGYNPYDHSPVGPID